MCRNKRVWLTPKDCSVSDPGNVGGSRGSHSHVGAHARQSKGLCPGGTLYGGAIPDTPVLESLSSHRGVMLSSSEPSGTQCHSHSSLGHGYSRDQPENQVGYNVTFCTPSAIADSHAIPLVRENVSLGRPAGNASASSSSWGQSERNIPAEAKSLR